MSHPCLTCGACCAHFRVGFHWSESDQHPEGVVPSALTEVLDGHRLVMKGTWAHRPRCVALDAEIGVYSRCSIHPQRPSVCRDVPASWEFGAPSAQCDKGRLAHGLPVLTPADWDYLKLVRGPAHEHAPAATVIPHVLLDAQAPILLAAAAVTTDAEPGTPGSSAPDPQPRLPARSGRRPRSA